VQPLPCLLRIPQIRRIQTRLGEAIRQRWIERRSVHGGSAFHSVVLHTHRSSILARHEQGLLQGGRGGIAFERQMRGYRVRVRVVEECEVALLAESADDAKARAEADLRRGDKFEDIQDSWPEEVVSVEAVAVEPYPDLE
jgi:hypothetical protein